ILTVMLLPGAFFLGLVCIPIGEFLRFRRERRAGRYPARLRTIDLGSPAVRKLLIFVIATTTANVIIGGQLVYRSVHYMESVQFCGTMCHTVMRPEYTAYQNSPHSRVACVQCHIGPGASWAVKSKIDGVRQVWAVLLNNYDRPIPTPVRELRPARETCEQCHWPQKFGSNRLRVIDKYADDEQNSHTRTVLLMRLGGGVVGPEAHAGIHGAHLGPGITIRYAHADERRQNIPWISYENNARGRKAEYLANDVKGDAVRGMPVRIMDCMDCHTRPSHSFDLPERAVDQALGGGLMDPTLPFIRKRAVEILKVGYSSEQDARRRIPAALAAYYPGQESARRAGDALFAIWNRNVFPEMRINWGTYPNNIGHTDFPGCFRCHDEKNVDVADKKKTMTQDCGACHQLVAMDEPAPKILSDLGLEPPAGAQTGGNSGQ
ncbi:MAG TPA: NapC/NirT family cytochrome c, partial [Bryobacteraceae bacterium]|nr:NapC/NirT family cytochrome c [Bryobacteraceae bacterium]